MLFLQLFFQFFKVGLFAIGGGMATIPFLYEMSDATAWFTHQDLANMIAVSESTPGPIGINMATYVGFISGSNFGGMFFGFLGAITATLGLITPSIIIILIIAQFLKAFSSSKYVNNAFYGLRPASTALIAAAGLLVIISTLFNMEILEKGFSMAFFNWKAMILAFVLWIFTNRVKKTKKWHPIIFIGISAVVGILLGM